jgi:hypothetical protein
MSKRIMPNLDALDAGESAVLGIREQAELDELDSPLLVASLEYTDFEPASIDTIAALFDTYE